MQEMADLHNHALFGVDDGAQTMAICEQMLTSAFVEGVRTLCFTPHFNPSVYFCPPEEIKRRFERVCAFAEKRLPGMNLYLGNEVYGYPTCVRAMETGKCLPLGNGRAVLVEFSPGVVYREMRNCFLSWFAAGYIPMLAHAERYQCLLREPARVEELSEMRVGIQVNATSILRLSRLGTYRFVHRLLWRRLVDVVASDAHGIGNDRVSAMRAAYRKVEKKYGENYAKHIFCINPKRYLSVKF